MANGKIQAGLWQASVLGIDGFRLDEAKGIPLEATTAFSIARPGLNYAEVYEGNPDMLANFVQLQQFLNIAQRIAKIPPDCTKYEAGFGLSSFEDRG